MQPRTGHLPVRADGAFGDTEPLGRLGLGQPPEEAHFNDPSGTLVMSFETIERLVQSEDVDSRTPRHIDQHDTAREPASFLCTLGPGMIHQDVPHRIGRPRPELDLRAHLHAAVSHHAEPQFVHQGCGLEGVVGPLRPEQVASDSAEFGMECRHIPVPGIELLVLGTRCIHGDAS